ncbi:hypothetical protein EST38_g12741 [Candolleomyces aberdarensis]|uniref:Uncharacterized protein n=1 Tax=Candolleomyces aberdarensis TaxID=2316362 RepID=A0A4Q2D1P7_9AGAR|nr:hypothetical protein EST38_g12741 [Candolleomyces aberdarensis]
MPRATTLWHMQRLKIHSRIHVAALVIANYAEDYSHFLAESSLGAWLKENGVPALYGMLTKDSRGLSIGQAGEFDHSGSQAIRALKERDTYATTVNPNIATVTASEALADKVNFLSVTPEFVCKIIKYEQPDGVYATFGRILRRTWVRQLPLRRLSDISPSFVLRACGEEYEGWKEIECEAVRDRRDGWITACNTENFGPLGIHTGDSTAVAPSQTLSGAGYNMLRTTAVNVISHLGVVGECNVQYST